MTEEKKISRRTFVGTAVAAAAVAAAAGYGVGLGSAPTAPARTETITETVTEIRTVAQTTAVTPTTTALPPLSRYTQFGIDIYDGINKPATMPLAEVKQWDSPPPEYKNKKEIVLGMSLPLTGVFAPAGGTQWQEIFKAYAERINNAGGLLAIPLSLKIYDDASDPARAIANYEKLIKVDKVDLLFSSFPTPTNMPVFNAIDGYGKMIINVGAATVKGLTQDFGPGFKNVISAQCGAEALTYCIFQYMNSMPKEKRPKKVAISYGEFSPFTTDVGNGARDMAQAFGYDLVLFEGYPIDVTDMTPTVQKVVAAGAECYLGCHTTVEASELAVKAMKTLDYSPPVYWDFMLLYPNWVDPQRPGKAHPDIYYLYANAMHWPTFPDPPYKDVAEWVAWYEKKFGLASPVWDFGQPIHACQLLEQAVNATGTLDDQKLIRYIESHSFYTMEGRIEYPPPYHYNRGKINVPAQYDGDGTLQVVWPEQFATGEAVYPRPPWSQIHRP